MYQSAAIISSVSSRKTPKPDYGRELAARRTRLGKSQDDIDTETDGLIYKNMLYRLENGRKSPDSLTYEQTVILAKALDWPINTLNEVLGVKVPIAERLRDLERFEVHPDWVPFPVYGSVSAGDSDPQPIENEIAYFPLEKFKSKGVKAKDVKVYLVNGDCLVSSEAQRAEKNIAPGDYIAVDTGAHPVPGDVVVAYWPKEDKMVVKRYRVEADGIVLYPTKLGHPNIVLDHEDNLNIIGRVVMRTG